MTYTKKRVLPALHQSGKVSKPDLQSIGDSNYTDTILRYNNLAVKFPQLETNAKTIVEAINELYRRPSGEAQLYYYSYTNNKDVTICSDSPTPVGGDIETEDGLTLTTESGLVIETEQGSSSTSASVIADSNEVEIASITFNYIKKTSVKVETELNFLAYPKSSLWDTNKGAFWYQLYYYCDEVLITYSPYETIHFWDNSSDTNICKLCRDFIYHMEDVASGEHVFKITMKVGGIDYAKIPANNCNVILNDLGERLNPVPEPWDGKLNLSDIVPIASYSIGRFPTISDSPKIQDNPSTYPGVLIVDADPVLDLVSNMTVTVSGTSGGTSGITFVDNTGQLKLPVKYPLHMQPRYLFGPGITWDIEFGDMDAQFTNSHGILFGFLTANYQNGGFMWHRQTNRFGVWDNQTLWQDSNITDKNYFANSTLRFYIDMQGYWHIYKDGILIFEPELPLGSNNQRIQTCGIGRMASTPTTFYNMVVKHIKVWYYNG